MLDAHRASSPTQAPTTVNQNRTVGHASHTRQSHPYQETNQQDSAGHAYRAGPPSPIEQGSWQIPDCFTRTCFFWSHGIPVTARIHAYSWQSQTKNLQKYTQNKKSNLNKTLKKQQIKRKEIKEKRDSEKQPKTINNMAKSTYLSIITLNVNGLK